MVFSLTTYFYFIQRSFVEFEAAGWQIDGACHSWSDLHNNLGYRRPAEFAATCTAFVRATPSFPQYMSN